MEISENSFGVSKEGIGCVVPPVSLDTHDERDGLVTRTRTRLWQESCDVG